MELGPELATSGPGCRTRAGGGRGPARGSDRAGRRVHGGVGRPTGPASRGSRLHGGPNQLPRELSWKPAPHCNHSCRGPDSVVIITKAQGGGAETPRKHPRPLAGRPPLPASGYLPAPGPGEQAARGQEQGWGPLGATPGSRPSPCPGPPRAARWNPKKSVRGHRRPRTLLCHPTPLGPARLHDAR